MSESKVPNLKKLRSERLLTQVQIAEALGTHARTIARWETGDGEPGASELLKLARFFDVGIDQLISDLLPASDALSVRVSKLVGPELDYWVARSEGLSAQLTEDGPVFYVAGHGQSPIPSYSSEWLHGGPIIAREQIHLLPIVAGTRFDGKKLDKDGWLARCSEHPYTEFGDTPLIAAMRAHVARDGPQLFR
ncbi:DUF2591 family protein [Variovorax sp. J22P240]|uniref:phage protein NinX family protein n=1 Tax=Variovorax sp. J22P240 TaxID=3053514 RepID=UPI0025771B6F|nr:phage protein NinX family protein [Variovorax sp. J22P240]MDL9996970.1 DUF2591 family protein [Variovorax sp. J22P240]